MTQTVLITGGGTGIGAAVAPVVGVLGNDELALAVVMTAGVVIALIALVTVIRRTEAAPA